MWRIVEGPYLADLLAQPAAVLDTWSALRAAEPAAELRNTIPPNSSTRIVLTGMGSSYHALHPLFVRLVQAGFAPVMIETSELLTSVPGLLLPGTLVVAVSQSGASAETVRLVEKLPAGCRLLGVTNNPTSRLARGAAAVVPMRAGTEFTVSCKTYLASVTALAWLGSLFELDPDWRSADVVLNRAVEAMEAYLQSWRRHVTELREVVLGRERLFVTGRGESLAAVGTAGLIIKESARFPAEGMSSAAFRHGPLEILDSRSMVLVCEGAPAVAPLNLRLVADIRSTGAFAELLGPGSELEALRFPGSPPPTRPLLEMLPFQMLSLALAAQAGIEAGRFERASKVTTIE